MIIYCLVWNEICPTMILSSPIRGTYFSFHSLENLTRIKGKKHRFFHLSCLYHTQFEFHRSLEIKVYRCQTIQRRFVMQIHFFLSWNRFSRKSHRPWNISSPRNRLLLIQETKFYASVPAIRQLSQFTKHSVFLEIASMAQSVPFTISFCFLLCIIRLMAGLYPAVERIPHAKI